MRMSAIARIAVLLAAPLVAGPSPPQEGRASFTFDSIDPGHLPQGFHVEAGEWRVEEDASAPSPPRVLCQTARSPGSTFNLVLVDGPTFRDVDLSVRMKAVAGEEDRGGGLVWRARDGRNYYIARQNPLEDNFRVYKVVGGKRTQLESADLKASEGWHTLRVTMQGDRIECWFDGVKRLEARDSTFPEAGRIGLWTKSDARTRFDDLLAFAAGPPAGPVASAAQGGMRLDPEQIGRAAATAAALQPDGVVRISWPRSDVAVTVDGAPLKPFAGLTSWAAFKGGEHGAMAMGDTVVFQDEVTPAIDAAFGAGLEVTALHNHFLFDEPRVFFLHIGGSGDPEKLAAAVKAVWDAVRAVRRATPAPARSSGGQAPEAGSIDPAAIETILGRPVQSQEGMVKATIAREGEMEGMKVGGSMGLTTWAAFSGTGALASADGDFIMTAAEVQPVLRALRKGGLQIVALHNHMVGERPTFYFTHFWGKGPAADLARAIRGALDAQTRAGAAEPNH